jgi:CYTH domain-containing protein
MGYKNRELEVKFLAAGNFKIDEVNRFVIDALAPSFCVSTLGGISKDLYFHGQTGKKYDFVRVRFGDRRESSYITLKHTDKNTMSDRLELDLPINDPKMAKQILERCVGPAAGYIKKKYYTNFINHYDNVSVYQISGDRRIFVEVEATTERRLKRIIKTLKSGLDFELKEVGKSLYQLFIKERLVSR